MSKSKKEKVGVIRCYVGVTHRNLFNAHCKVLGLTQRELLIKLIEELPPIKQH